MEAESECVQVAHTFLHVWHQSVGSVDALLTKFLHRILVGSLLGVRCWLGTCNLCCVQSYLNIHQRRGMKVGSSTVDSAYLGTGKEYILSLIVTFISGVHCTTSVESSLHLSLFHLCKYPRAGVARCYIM